MTDPAEPPLIDPGYLFQGGTWPDGQWVGLGAAPPPDPVEPPWAELVDQGHQPWSIGDALAVLAPPPPRRTLARWLKELTPVSTRKPRTGGPAINEYDPRPVMKRHRLWVERQRAD